LKKMMIVRKGRKKDTILVYDSEKFKRIVH
jgi:hypothetical protein